MDVWAGLDSLALSVVEEAGNESFPLLFLHLFSLSLFLVVPSSFSLHFQFHVCYSFSVCF